MTPANEATAPLDTEALLELRTIVICSGVEALWVYRDPTVIRKGLIDPLVKAGYIVACDEPGQEWTRFCYRPTDAGREAAR